jgi:hypothetical protein
VPAVDDYLGTLAPEQAAALRDVRRVLLDLVPDAVRGELGPQRVSKGAIRVTQAEPLPDDVLRRLLEARVAEIDARGRSRP